MKKEDRELVLKDLCMRLPYGVNMLFNNSHIFTLHQINPNESTRKDGYGVIFDFGRTYSVNDCKPYLRPILSMTEEEKEDLLNYVVGKEGSINFEVCNDGYIRGIGMVWVNFQPNTTSRYIGWLLKNHFDICDLIPKGLALEAPKDMYNEIKEEKK